MSKSSSGRMVVELDPQLKKLLYASLAIDGLTFKQWLIQQAEQYVLTRSQPSLFKSESLIFSEIESN